MIKPITYRDALYLPITAWSLRSPNICSRQSGDDLGEPIVVPVQKLAGLRPKKSQCYSFESEGRKRLKSLLKAVGRDVPLTQGRVSLCSIQVFDWMRPTHLGEGNLLNSVYLFKY